MSLISTTPLQEEESQESLPAIRVLQLFEARGVRVQALAVLGDGRRLFFRPSSAPILLLVK